MELCEVHAALLLHAPCGVTNACSLCNLDSSKGPSYVSRGHLVVTMWSLVVRESSKLLCGPHFGGHKSHIYTRLMLASSGASLVAQSCGPPKILGLMHATL